MENLNQIKMENQKEIEQKWNEFQKENPEYVKAFSTEWVRLKEEVGENEPTDYLSEEEKYKITSEAIDELFDTIIK